MTMITGIIHLLAYFYIITIIIDRKNKKKDLLFIIMEIGCIRYKLLEFI